MSYGIYIGRAHTADGLPYLAGYGDEPSSHWLEIIPAASHAPEATITVGVTPAALMPGLLSEIPQAASTFRHMRVSYSHYLGVPCPLTNGGLNEYGVAVRDIWSTSSERLIAMTPKDQTGPNYSDLARIVLERARTAREGVQIIGDLIASHGYSTYGGNSHIIADGNEAWVVIEFAGGRRLWVAERLGDHSIRVSRPGYIGQIPAVTDENFLFPPHFISTAIDLGWYDPAAGVFDVNAVYGDGKGRWEGQAWIEAEMQSRAARPEKLGLQDIVWAIATEKLTGDTAGYGQIVPLTEPDFPEQRMMWHAAIGPVAAPLTPVFLGMDEVPPAYRQHRHLTEGESGRFLDRRKEAKSPEVVSRIPQGIESADGAVYQFRKLMHLAFQDGEALLPEIYSHWRDLEALIRADLPETLRASGLLSAAGERGLACRLLSDFSTRWMERSLDDCDALARAAYVRLRVRGGLNMTTSPLSPAQIW